MTTKQPAPPPKQNQLKVRLCGDHEYAVKIGSVSMEDGSICFVRRYGMTLVVVDFDDGDFTYASESQIEDAEPTSPPPPRKRSDS